MRTGGRQGDDTEDGYVPSSANRTVDRRRNKHFSAAEGNSKGNEVSNGHPKSMTHAYQNPFDRLAGRQVNRARALQRTYLTSVQY